MMGMNIKNWVYGGWLGGESGFSVNIAIHREGSTSTTLPSLTAVKSSPFLTSLSLKKEEDVLYHLQSSSHIITCYGHDHTYQNGHKFFHIFLEYDSGGSLADQLLKHGGKLHELLYVRRYTRSILKGLKQVHDNGFVHCNLKLENILVFDYGDVKIADFGLAKKIGKKNERYDYGGKPMFLSPEAVNNNEYEPPTDIWALGCVVIQMLTGKHAWNELPEIPQELSEDGKDFLQKCFIKDPNQRWSADMLLKHRFVRYTRVKTRCLNRPRVKRNVPYERVCTPSP